MNCQISGCKNEVTSTVNVKVAVCLGEQKESMTLAICNEHADLIRGGNQTVSMGCNILYGDKT